MLNFMLNYSNKPEVRFSGTVVFLSANSMSAFVILSLFCGSVIFNSYCESSSNPFQN